MKLRNELCPCQYAANSLPLHSNSTAVNDSKRTQTQPVRLFQISFRYTLDIAGRHGMQVERIRDYEAEDAV